MEKFIRGSGIIKNAMELGWGWIRKGRCIKECGKMTKEKVMDEKSSLKATSMKANEKTTNSMAKAPTPTTTAAYTQATGLKVSNLAVERKPPPMDQFTKGST